MLLLTLQVISLFHDCQLLKLYLFRIFIPGRNFLQSLIVPQIRSMSPELIPLSILFFARMDTRVVRNIQIASRILKAKNYLISKSINLQ